MAVLKGKGSMTGINLIARVYDNAVTKNGKTHFVDVQIDARDSRGPEQTNLHLRSRRTEVDGQTRYNNSAAYSVDQLNAIVEAGGDNVRPILDKDDQKIGYDVGFKGNVMPASEGPGLVVNTKNVGPSDFELDGKTMDNQFASMKAASEARAAARAEAAKEAPAVEAEAEVETETAVEAEVDEPSLG